MQLKELTNEQFKTFTKSFKTKSIYQSIEYGLVMNHENYDTIFLGLINDNEIIAASLVIIEKKGNFKYAYAPRGFLIDYNDFKLLKTFTLQIKKYLGKLGVVAIKLCPPIIKEIVKNNNTLKNEDFNIQLNNLKNLGYKHLGYNNYFESLKPRYEAVLDLNSSYYNLFKNIKKQIRTKIRKAEKVGIRIYKGDINDLDYLYIHTKNKYNKELEYFKNCYKYFSKENKIEFYFAKLDTVKFLKLCNKKYIIQEELQTKLNKELKNNANLLKEKMNNDILLDKYKSELIYATRLIDKYPEGVVVSSALIINDNKEIHLLMDGYDTKFKRLNSKHLLIWKLIQKYSGYKCFNFGGIINPNIKDNKYSGLNEFKLGFNSDIYEYIGDFELITNKILYTLYKTKK